jgi:hypothetical protein
VRAYPTPFNKTLRTASVLIQDVPIITNFVLSNNSVATTRGAATNALSSAIVPTFNATQSTAAITIFIAPVVALL